MTFAKKAFAITRVTAFATVTAVSATLAGGTVLAQSALNGAGASFPAPFYQAAFASAASKGIRVNYQSVGSGAGVRQFVAGTVDFGATDEPIKAAEAAKVKRGVVQFPAVGGTIAIAYNNPACKNLKLSQKQAVDIFLGKISSWDQLKCGKGRINVVHRSDGSGTTFAFTNSLSAFSSEWKSKVGEGKSVKWPVGIGGKGNEGVAGVLANTPGSIGYVNQAFVKGKLKAVALQNKAGKYVLPNVRSGAAALNNIRLDGNLAGEDPNPAGAESYPISTLTWILAYKSGNGSKAGQIRQAMLHLLGPAQNRADDLGYVPLKGNVLSAAKKAVGSIGS
ncbi:MULTISPECIES: phosphate ABC transporter substrate-binding protein PstS [Aphanothece]|uniref:phosphate ABC transporter substrate-binding protein PstS n=1 Tax=Aphanothece TaxID=1121 RepID=UPI00398F2456